MNLLLLQALARELDDRLRGRTFGAPRGLAPILDLPMGGEHLVVLGGSPGPFCLVTDTSPFGRVTAPQRLRGLARRRVAGVRLLNADRIIAVEMEGDARLVIALYGSAARVALEQGHHTSESFGRPGRVEDDTPPGGASILDITPDDLASIGDGKVRGLEDPLRGAFTNGGQLDAAALCRFRDGVLAGGVRFDLLHSRSLANATPLPPGAGTMGPFDSALAACGAVGNELLVQARRAIIDRLAQPLRRKLAANRKLVANLERDVARAQDFAAIRREAETLAAFQASIAPGQSVVELPDVYEPDQTVHIALDPAQPLHVQIEKRFRRATKLEKSLAHAGRRLELVRAEMTAVTASLTLLDQAETLDDAMRRFEAMRAKFDLEPPRAAGGRKRQTVERTFRRFDLAGGWFVLVGRNNQENDELTFHRASPGDVWLHAQGVPGSHVILKNDGPSEQPPQKVIEVAASVAAYYSRARHSGLVPVIYTQRRYVRKFRGAAPGQVRCERERMVMVPPSLPA